MRCEELSGATGGEPGPIRTTYAHRTNSGSPSRRQSHAAQDSSRTELASPGGDVLPILDRALCVRGDGGGSLFLPMERRNVRWQQTVL